MDIRSLRATHDLLKEGASHDGTLHRIARHAHAFALFEDATGVADETAAKREGRTITEKQWAEYRAADQAEQQAFKELLASVPPSIVEMHRKVRYLQMHLTFGFNLNDDEIDLLLASILEFHPRERGVA